MPLLMSSRCEARSGKSSASSFMRVCSKLGIEHLLDRHPYDLSGGEQQKAALAKLLVRKPRILLLDEPTKGMDYDAKLSTIALVKELRGEGLTMILVTHDAECAALCADRCALLFDGSIVSNDTPERFFSSLSHYTTAAAHISRGFFENTVTARQLVSRLESSEKREVNRDKT